MSGLVYERGDPAQPVGHAFVYFGTRGDQQVLATYIVVPPIMIDLAKYMPPMLASTLGSTAMASQAPFLPVPPVPEPIQLGQLLGLAELRNDDVLVGGFHKGPQEPAALLGQVVEIGEAYARGYQESVAREPLGSQEPEPESLPEDSPQVRALLYATVSERERLEALARELSSLRYGLEVDDRGMIKAALEEMRAIATSLPGKYRAAELMEVAARTDPGSVRLAQLYLERGYKLCVEDYQGLATIDDEIALLHGRER